MAIRKPKTVGKLVLLPLTRLEANALIHALSVANASSETPQEHKGPNTWVAKRLLKQLSEDGPVEVAVLTSAQDLDLLNQADRYQEVIRGSQR